MGNEQSQLSGIEIDEKSLEVSDFWSQHSAFIIDKDNVTNLTVFIGELFVSGALWSSQTPLEKNSKNLMIYRHPCILKYISSWQKSSKYYLAVEEVEPLSHHLPSLNSFQICIGLHSILKAIVFLHENAGASHNNICITSIYVTKEGNWKLGAMEYLCRYSNLTEDYLNKSREHRYKNAVDCDENKHLKNCPERKDFIDVFAFATLVCEILKSKKNDEIPTLLNFKHFCETNILQNVNISERPKLSTLLNHEFFNHEFISIHSFLVELPLKNDEEKTSFFLNLLDRFKQFDEGLIGSQLGSLLLSRLVLLNKTAQANVLPIILLPRNDNGGFFSENTFKQYLSPKILEIFSVRDAQIRLLLLNHFTNFIQTFSKDELQSKILPELLLGIKDTNDHLVAVTLRTLADLVPILGAETVIGGKRAKLFIDGRPNQMKRSRNIKVDSMVANRTEILPERPRPDGEEVESSNEDIVGSAEEDLDNWEDWDNENTSTAINEDNGIDLETENLNLEPPIENLANLIQIPQVAESRPRSIPDINELDIKNQLNNAGDDIDFFQDMEPVIQSTNKFLIDESKPKDDFINKEVSSKLSFAADENEDGWGDEEWE